MTRVRELAQRAQNRWRRSLTRRFGRRDHVLDANVPYVSFTFDDFPRSALVAGGRILVEHGVRGTYFISLRLAGQPSVSGPIASHDDLVTLLRDGHELGCHTFDHLDGCRSTVAAFEHSIHANRAALEQIVPGRQFDVFAYPLDGPILSIKRVTGKHFVGCRGGGQAFNHGAIDLNLLNAYFLDRRNRGEFSDVRRVIEENASARGWLIFATHDVTDEPSEYGCTPAFFEEVVRLAAESGARVVPMMRACEELRIAR